MTFFPLCFRISLDISIFWHLAQILANNFRMAGRARLPLVVRRRVQKWIRNFAFFGLSYIILWQVVTTTYNYNKSRDMLMMFGFVPGIV